jgi:hypothetical protein
MDFFVRLKLKCKTLKALNRCQVFLQVIWLSDICIADGRSILPEYKSGDRPFDWSSSLDWPFQPRPPRPDWIQWENALHHLESHKTLSKPRGAWSSASHQNWPRLYDPATAYIFQQNKGVWSVHKPGYHPSHAHYTRSRAKPWYSLSESHPTPAPPPNDVPASIVVDPLYDSDLFQIQISPNEMPKKSVPSSPRHINTTDDSISPHPFYQHLLQWDTNAIAPQAAAIAAAIEAEDLHICADGAYMATYQQGSHAWVL